MKAIVLLADGFEECEALIVVDILRRAGIKTIMASTTGRIMVDSSRHIVVKADTLLEKVIFDEYGLLILPGGRLGTDNLAKCNLVREQCIEFADNKIVAAICAAPSILAELGLIKGKMATCHPDYEKVMNGAIITRESVAIAENIITGQGLGATFDFAFKLAEMIVGEEITNQIKESICYSKVDKS